MSLHWLNRVQRTRRLVRSGGLGLASGSALGALGVRCLQAGAFGNDLIVYEDVAKEDIVKKDDGPSLEELRERLAAQGFEVPAEDAAMDREELLRVLQAIAS